MLAKHRTTGCNRKRLSTKTETRNSSESFYIMKKKPRNQKKLTLEVVEGRIKVSLDAFNEQTSNNTDWSPTNRNFPHTTSSRVKYSTNATSSIMSTMVASNTSWRATANLIFGETIDEVFCNPTLNDLFFSLGEVLDQNDHSMKAVTRLLTRI